MKQATTIAAHAEGTRSTSRRWLVEIWRILCTLPITVPLTLLACEGALRLGGLSYPVFFSDDPRRGWGLEAGTQGWWRAEGESYVKINSQGLRDREHTIAKPDGVIRIAILGDSVAEAMAIPIEQTFWATLEKKLARCPRFRGKEVEAINFGVTGYSTVQEYLTLQDEVWKYSPDIVVTAMFTGNDIMDNWPEIASTPARPYYHLEDNKLVLDLSMNRTSSLLTRTAKRSCILQLVRQARGRMANMFVAVRGIQDVGLVDEVFRPPTTDAWKNAWTVTRALLNAMRDEARAHRAEFWVATLSNPIQVHPDPSRRGTFTSQLGVADLFYPDREIARFGREDGFRTITLATRMLTYAVDHKTCLHGFANNATCAGHWNAEGHRLGGELMADEICAAQ